MAIGNPVPDKAVVAGLVKKSNRILASISTHKFPIDLFPDSLNVEEGRITIITRTFVSKGIDTSVYTKKELITKLKELSNTEIVT